MSNLIGSVIWTPQKSAAGDSVKIDVCDSSGKPYQNQGSTLISIDGVRGTGQFLQFALAGDHKVPVSAIGPDGTEEQTTTTITVAAPVLSEATRKALADPANAKLPAEQIAYLKATSDVSLLTVTAKAPYGKPHAVAFNLHPLIKFFKPPVAPVARNGAAAGGSPVAGAASAPATPDLSTRWTWDFGDGSKPVTTTVPAADHDYSASLGNTQEFKQFDVSVTQVRISADGKDAVPTGSPWKRTLSVHNPYVAIKNRGYVVLTVNTQGSATKDGKNFVGTAEIKNIEAVPITLSSRLIVPVLQDTSVLTAPTALEALASPIVVPANGSITTKVSVPFSQVAEDAVGFKAIFTNEVVKDAKDDKAGASPPSAATKSPLQGLKVRATAHFQVQPEYRGKAVAEKKDGTKPTAKDDPAMPPVKESNQCDPDNLPSDAPATLACQITPKTAEVLIPAQFLNAAKGDVILCPSVGDASLVDAMFSQLNQPQLYGHSGIMTRNYDQITHCTASESRLINYTVSGLLGGGDEGFDPDALKYGWPGAITETVDQAVNGQKIADPSLSACGQQYGFQSFSGTSSDIPIQNRWILIPPLSSSNRTRFSKHQRCASC